MKSKLLFISIVAFFSCHLNAQNVDKQVFSNAGESIKSSSHSLTFTLGEPIVGIVSNNTTIHQGFLATVTFKKMVSVADQIKSDAIKIYPNPVQNNLNIELSDNSSDVQLVLFDVSGQQLMSKELNASHNQLNTSDLIPGMYLINIYNPETNFIKSFKIIKK